jgi:hypothetical protein
LACGRCAQGARIATALKSRKAAKRNPDQREILLLIAGGGPVKEAAEKQPAKASARKKAG